MRIKTAILGFGRSGASLHALPLRAIDDYEICAVADVSEDRSAKAKNELKCRTYNDYHQMLKEELALVTTDSALYLTQILDAIRTSDKENRIVEL